MTAVEPRPGYTAEAGLELLAAGWAPLPTKIDGSKQPAVVGVTGWNGRDATAETIERWANDPALAGAGIAVRMPVGVVGLDVDHYDDKRGADELAALVEQLGPLPPSWSSTARGDGPSRITFYRVPEWATLRANPAPSIEVVQRHHRYAMVAPSIHPRTRTRYRWYDASGAELDEPPNVEDLPDLPFAWVDALHCGKTAGAQPVTLAEVAEWIDAHTADNAPEKLRGIETRLRRGKRRSSDLLAPADHGSRHDTLVEVWCWAAREATAGAYPARAAFDTLHRWWLDVMHDDPHRRGTADAPSSEFLAAAQWAVAQAHDTPPATPALVVVQDDETDEPHPVNLPADLWNARPALAHIRTAAEARMIAPDAVLAAVLARAVALSHHQLVLPPIVGRVSPPNLFVGIVAPSGLGKGSAIDAATELLPTPADLHGLCAGRFAAAPVGSGEGLVHTLFTKRRSDTDKRHTETVRDAWNLLVRIDEGELLARLGQRRDQTTLQVLRQVWSGETIGQSYASEDKNLKVPELSYRAALVLGVQPEHAAAILDDRIGGLPQRFIWFAGTCASLPDDLPDWPGPIDWHPARLGEAHHRHEMRVDPAIVAELRAAHRARVTGTAPADDYDGHAGLRQLKTAAALALLDGRHAITADDWHLAATIEATSNAVRTAAIAAIAAQDRQTERRYAERAARQAVAAHAAVEDREAAEIERVARHITRIVSAHTGPARSAEVRRQLAGRDRKPYFTVATEYALDAGWITAHDDGTYSPGGLATTSEGMRT